MSSRDAAGVGGASGDVTQCTTLRITLVSTRNAMIDTIDE